MRCLNTFLWIVVGTQIAFAQTAEEWFQKGNTAYTNAAYKQAEEAYLNALDLGEHSSALYYNLGNTYYRLNAVAESIYYYEKGLLLDPDDADLNHNILFARNMTVDAIEQLPITQLTAWKQAVLNVLSLDQWSVLSLVLVWFFFFSILAYYLQKKVATKKRLFVLGLSFVLLALGAFFAGYTKNQKMMNEQYGILFSEKMDVSNEPNTRSEVAFVLHEGTKVQILEQFQEWQKIRIANGAEGWIFRATIREL